MKYGNMETLEICSLQALAGLFLICISIEVTLIRSKESDIEILLS